MQEFRRSGQKWGLGGSLYQSKHIMPNKNFLKNSWRQPLLKLVHYSVPSMVLRTLCLQSEWSQPGEEKQLLTYNKRILA